MVIPPKRPSRGATAVWAGAFPFVVRDVCSLGPLPSLRRPLPVPSTSSALLFTWLLRCLARPLLSPNVLCNPLRTPLLYDTHSQRCFADVRFAAGCGYRAKHVCAVSSRAAKLLPTTTVLLLRPFPSGMAFFFHYFLKN